MQLALLGQATEEKNKGERKMSRIDFIPEDERAQLIQVVNSLQIDCITQETAQKLISKLISASDPVELDFNAKMDGIKRLVQMNYLSAEEGLSYINRLAEHEIKVASGGKARVVHKRESHGRSPNESYTRRFAPGELTDAIISSIQRGNVTSKAIVLDVANTHGHKVSHNFDASARSSLGRLERIGVLESVDGNWRVLEFKDSAQAGIKSFTSRKEIEASTT
jgi:hypothetical protein